MAANKKDVEWFDDVFDLSSEKKDDDNEQTEEYGHGTGSSDSFDDLAKDVSDDIEKSEDKGSEIPGATASETPKEDPHDIIKSVCSDGDVDDLVQDIAEKAVEEESDDDFFDELPVKKEEVSKDPINDPEDETNSSPVVENHSKSPISNSATIGPPSGIDYDMIGQGSDQIEWLLDSPSSMYNGFYQKKRNLLFRYMVGGQIEYKRWTQELLDAQVIIKGEIFDHELIIKQMEAVQQHRERVKAIHVRVNNQYFTFRRFVEMMKGTLARIEYLKPIIRQEGLIMEHMRDVELYYARLEALHDSATKTEKTLEKAFDTLSRKCTICMELKAPERVDLQSQSTSYTPPAYIPPVREKSKEFDEFDDLPSNAQAVPVGYKIGAIGWGDV